MVLFSRSIKTGFFKAVEEGTVGVSLSLEDERRKSPYQVPHPPATQLSLPHRSNSLPNPNLSNHHPYGIHWVQERMRHADGSPLINVVPATPADSVQSLSMTEVSTVHGDPTSTQMQLLQALHTSTGTPPPSDPSSMSASQTSGIHQDPSLSMQSTGKNKRVAFGPRLDCEKCRLGETHFAHVHYD